MTYTSVAQIYEEIDGTRERLYRHVAALSDEQLNTRPDPSVWSVADILEHLAIMEDRLLRMMKVMLTKAEGAGSNGAPTRMQPFSLDEFIERSRCEKYVAPEAVRPRGTEQAADLLVRMRSSREELHSLRPRIETIDLSTITYPHPVFGALNFYQWLAFIGVHEERHLRQAEALLSA